MSRFSGVKCLIKNNDLTFSFEMFVCARVENVHPSASQNERFALSTLPLPKLRNTLFHWVDLTSLSLPTLVGWSLNVSRQKKIKGRKRKKKEKKNEEENKVH